MPLTSPFKHLLADGPIGLLFDVDGLLVDNSHEIRLAYERLLQNRGLTVDPGETFPGQNLFDILAGVKRRYHLSASVEELVAERRRVYLDILSQGTFDPCDGVAELFRFLDERRKRINARFAYVSSSEKPFTDIVFQKLFPVIGLNQYASNPEGFFYNQNGKAGGTSWEPGMEKKPHPMLYEMGCRKLNLKPSQCIAFEDSPSGAQAALNAGMNLVVVGNGGHQDARSALMLEAQRDGRLYEVKSLRECLPLIQALADTV